VKDITANIFFQELNNNSTISDLKLIEPFRLSDFKRDQFDYPIRITSSIIGDFDISFTTFIQKIRIENTKINSLFGMSCFFNAGFELLDCEILENSDFSCGGHNKNGAIFQISNCVFHGSVTFCDSWFEDIVILEENDFKKGTDILYAGYETTGTSVVFEKGYSIKKNHGDVAKKV
jgi:hypothetical protein